MAAVCVMLSEPPTQITEAGKSKSDYWTTGVRILKDAEFVNRLASYDRDNLDPAMMRKIREEYLILENFRPAVVRHSSRAAEGMCAWVCAMSKYNEVDLILRPKKAALNEAEAELAGRMAELNKREVALKAVDDEINMLRAEHSKSLERLKELASEEASCASRLKAASSLLASLAVEKNRWVEARQMMAEKRSLLAGEMLMSAGLVSMGGAMSSHHRTEVLSAWGERLKLAGVAYAPEGKTFALDASLGDSIKIETWCGTQGLPKEKAAIESALILDRCKEERRIPVLLDPHGRAKAWLLKQELDIKLMALPHDMTSHRRSLRTKSIAAELASAIELGGKVLLSGIKEHIPDIIREVIFSYSKVGSRVQVGGSYSKIHPSFRLYLSSEEANPKHLAEEGAIAAKLSMINFIAQKEGLVEHLLAAVIAHERFDLVEENARLLNEHREQAASLSACEDAVLTLLETSESILDDDEALKELQKVKSSAEDTKQRSAETVLARARVATATHEYLPCAKSVGTLFALLEATKRLCMMSDFSLQWFESQFQRSLKLAQTDRRISERCKYVTNHFTESVFRALCAALAPQHHLALRGALTIISASRSDIFTQQEVDALVHLGGNDSDSSRTGYENQDLADCPEGLDHRAWCSLKRLSILPKFKGLLLSIREHLPSWLAIMRTPEPERVSLPRPFHEQTGAFKVTSMRHAMIIASLRPDIFPRALQGHVSSRLSPKLASPAPFTLREALQKSDAKTPLILVLECVDEAVSMDPIIDITALAEEGGRRGQDIQIISMGQGQGKKATAALRDAASYGGWVVLVNAHLSPEWLPELETEWRSLQDEEIGGTGLCEGFRLWVTSSPCMEFPSALLQGSIKVNTTKLEDFQTSVGSALGKNILISDVSEEQAEIYSSMELQSTPEQGLCQRLCIALSILHASLLERNRFQGGWKANNSTFAPEDAVEACAQLQGLLLRLPTGASINDWQKLVRSLVYLCSSSYGGKLTEMEDRASLAAIVNGLLKAALSTQADGQVFTLPGIVEPAPTDPERLPRWLEGLPTGNTAKVLGLMAPDADIQRGRKESGAILASLKNLLKPAGVNQDSSISFSQVLDEQRDFWEMASKQAASLLEAIPEPLKMSGEPKLMGSGSILEKVLEGVRELEVQAYAILLDTFISSLNLVGEISTGLTPPTQEVRALAACLVCHEVPNAWRENAQIGAHHEGIRGFVTEFTRRITSVRSWQKTIPCIYDLSVVMNPARLLGASLRGLANEAGIPLEEARIDISPEDHEMSGSSPSVRILGLELHGAGWLSEPTGGLMENIPRDGGASIGNLRLTVVHTSSVLPAKCWQCPLYDGHEGATIGFVGIRSSLPNDVWIKRAVAVVISK